MSLLFVIISLLLVENTRIFGDYMNGKLQWTSENWLSHSVTSQTTQILMQPVRNHGQEPHVLGKVESCIYSCNPSK